MCLDHQYSLSKISKKILTYETGFKRFRFSNNINSVASYFRECQKVKRLTIKKNSILNSLPIGEWLIDKNKKDIRDSFNRFYPSGFHIYIERKKDLQDYFTNSVLYKVYFKNIVAYGIDNGLDTIVAKEMFICPKDEWNKNLPSYLK